MSGFEPEKIWAEWMDDSFFSKPVQAVLEKRHPENWKYGPNDSIAYPIFMWREAHYFTLFSTPAPAFLDTLRGGREMDWTCDLIKAVKAFRVQRANPKTTIEKFMRWRIDHMLDELSKIKPAPKPGSWSEIALGLFGRHDHGGDVRLRKALHDENARREKILNRWEAQWIAYYLTSTGAVITKDRWRDLVKGSKIALPELQEMPSH